MRKISLFIASVFLVLTVFSTVVSAQEVSLFLNNEEVKLSAPPVFENQRTMVTLDSDFFKKAGVVTAFDKETATVTIDGDYSSVKFAIGEKTALVYRKFDFTGLPEKVEMDVAPFVHDNEVYVPLRFAAEGLGALVEWDGVKKSVIVTYERDTHIIPVERPVEYEEINISDLAEDDELYLWVMENRNSEGIYHKTLNNKNYVLICAGEKPSGGYSVEITSVTLVYPGRVYITAEVTEPSPDMFVTTVITYPCRLIALEIDGEITVDGIIGPSRGSDNAEDIVYEIVSLGEIAADEELSAWVDRFREMKGIQVKEKDGYIYTLIAAGQRNSGGYSVEIDRVVKEESSVYIYATVISPSPDMIVITAITWPYTVIRFKGDGIKMVSGEIQGSDPITDIILFE
ncbi:MAG: protease complex subunit PrcB family protein [Clostridiaceae bacterium]|nr:protease complex subunit PrcB family protein [Clostridiaceae bacterium]